MITTPLFRIENGIYYQQFKVGSYVYSTVTDFNIIKKNRYIITDIIGSDIEIINENGEKEIYTHDYFSMTSLQ